MIVYFVPVDKKLLTNQFHIEAVDNKTALKELQENIEYPVEVLGISNYFGSNFKNKTVY